MNVFAELGHRGVGLVDPWDFQDPTANPPAPCRTIEITDEIRAADAAAQASRAPSSDWKIKESLSSENLRLVRRPVAKNRVEHRPVIVTAPRPARPARKKAVRPEAPTPPQKEIPIMTEAASRVSPHSRICECKPDCGVEYQPSGNRQRFAPGHKPETKSAKPAKTAREKKPVRKPTTVSKAIVPVAAAETVAINVPVAALDSFWLRLSTDTKVRAVERFLAGELS